MTPVVITAPASEPVTLAEIKAHLKIVNSSQDTELGLLITAARSHVETTLGRAMMATTLEGYLAAFPASGVIRLPVPPLASVTSVKYLDEDISEQTFSAESYHVEPQATEAKIRLADGASWPFTATHPRAVRIRWIAGHDDVADVPPALKHAIKLLVSHWYYNREATGDARQALPLAYKALTDPFATHGWI